MEILTREGIKKIFETYCNDGSIYRKLVGITGKTFPAEEYFRQKSFVDILMKTLPDGFNSAGTPKSTFESNEPFCHIISNNFDIKKTKHRLYFNLGENQVPFAIEFVNMCQYLANIPYYIKFHKTHERSDGTVIYVDSDENLEIITKILEQISHTNPEFTERRDLPMSTYNCSWFGYGKEMSDQRMSFNGYIENSFENTLAAILYESGYDVTDGYININGEQQLEFSKEKIIESSRILRELLNDENSDGFYDYLIDRLSTKLQQDGLMLNDQTVPACISQQNLEMGM